MEEKDNKLLLIVDPQIDFIKGTLPVPCAEDAMNTLTAYVDEHGDDYGHILVTCDHHPLSHSSFKEYGGEWPAHCVMSSVGAAIWPPLMEALMKRPNQVEILYKGKDLNQDEYSIFQNRKGSQSLKVLLNDGKITDLDICGLAGDVCVKNTLEDAQALYPGIKYHILESCTASLDGGEYISTKIKDLNKKI